MGKKSKTIFSCSSCGYQTPKWIGKCPDCNQWDCFVEEAHSFKEQKSMNRWTDSLPKAIPVSANQDYFEIKDRLLTGINEFDGVLGGGLVPGSLILIGGDPGIGKSTLMLQALYGLTTNNHKALYVSGEESIQQIGIRCQRLATKSPDLLAFAEVDLESIFSTVESIKPDILVIDSIQTMFNSDLTSTPGSVSQVRESAMRLMQMAKKTGIPTILIGHVTKEGAIAGPRILEHMVDTVLYFEGEANHVFRILRAVKNRFGPTNEIGVFEMKDKGLIEVPNPSSVFLSERPAQMPGSVVTCCMEGTRPILVELQALTGNASFGTSRRTIFGLDQNRVALLSAVMEKKLNMHLIGQDIFMNVTGGVKVDEPALDMGIVFALASSFFDRAIRHSTIVLGEVGLTGEVRSISQIEARVSEIKKMGFTHCLIPQSNLQHTKDIRDITIGGVKTVSQAVEMLF